MKKGEREGRRQGGRREVHQNVNVVLNAKCVPDWRLYGELISW